MGYIPTKRGGFFYDGGDIDKRSLRSCVGDTEIHHYWLEIVEMYSARELSRMTDRLPALSGMAHSFGLAFAPKDDYLAGMWRRNLIGSLAWIRQYRKDGDEDSLVRAAADQSAPSWSWASNSGGVKFVILDDFQRIRPYKTDSSVDSVRVFPKGLDPLGRVSEGTLTLAGRLTKILLEPCPHETSLGTFRVTRVPATELKAHATLDCRPSNLLALKANICKEAYALLLVYDVERDLSDESSQTVQWQWFGLVLEKAETRDGRDIFRRIGIVYGTRTDYISRIGWVEGTKEDYFEGCERKILDIV